MKMCSRAVRVMKVVGTGVVLLQFGGCTFQTANEFIQTILLGVTAAGSVAILQNI